MASKNDLWHEISWDEKKYFNNVTSTNSSEPVEAMYLTDENGKPMARYLTKQGKKYYGVEDDDDVAARIRTAQKESNDDDSLCSGCGPLCSICKCIYKLFCCFCG